MSEIFLSQGKFEMSADVELQILNLNKKLQSKNNNAISHKEEKNVDSERNMYEKVEKVGNITDMAKHMGNLGIKYEEEGNISQAIICYQKTKDLYMKLNDTKKVEEFSLRIKFITL